MNNDVKPCMWCGSQMTAIYKVPLIDDYQVQCRDCGGRGSEARTSVDAVTMWNLGAEKWEPLGVMEVVE